MVRAGASLEVDTFWRFLDDRLPSDCLPKAIAVICRLPMRGKVQRRAVREASLQRTQMTEA